MYWTEAMDKIGGVSVLELELSLENLDPRGFSPGKSSQPTHQTSLESTISCGLARAAVASQFLPVLPGWVM